MIRATIKALIVVILLMLTSCAFMGPDGDVRALVIGYAGEGTSFVGIGYVRFHPMDAHVFEKASSGPRLDWYPNVGAGLDIIHSQRTIKVPTDKEAFYETREGRDGQE